MSLFRVLYAIYSGSKHALVQEDERLCDGLNTMHGLTILDNFVSQSMPSFHLLAAPTDFSRHRQQQPADAADSSAAPPSPNPPTFPSFMSGLAKYMAAKGIIKMDEFGQLLNDGNYAADFTGSMVSYTPARLIAESYDTWNEFMDSMYPTLKMPVLNIETRAAAWRVLLGVVDRPCHFWPDQYKKHENFYKITLLRVVKSTNLNELNISASTIHKDVPRAQLGDAQQELMLKIALGTAVAKDPTIGYAQSMSHIGAVLVKVFYPQSSETQGAKLPPSCSKIADMFSGEDTHPFLWRLTDVIIGLQKISEQVQQLLVKIDETGAVVQDAGPIAIYCKQILSKVALIDPALHEHIVLTLSDYGSDMAALMFLSWVDCIFAHKMPFDSVCKLWDFLFAGFVHRISFMKRLEMFCATLCQVQRSRIMNVTNANDMLMCISTLPEQDCRGSYIPIPIIIRNTCKNLDKYFDVL